MDDPLLLVGLRGDFVARVPLDEVHVGGALALATERGAMLDKPWGQCDAGGDLARPGPAVLRAWRHLCHPHPAGGGNTRDLPVYSLLRSAWDEVSIFGELALTGVDVVAPLAFAPARLSGRTDLLTRGLLGLRHFEQYAALRGASGASVVAGFFVPERNPDVEGRMLALLRTVASDARATDAPTWLVADIDADVESPFYAARWPVTCFRFEVDG